MKKYLLLHITLILWILFGITPSCFAAQTLIEQLIEGDFDNKILIDQTSSMNDRYHQIFREQTIAVEFATDVIEDVSLQATIEVTQTHVNLQNFQKYFYAIETLYDTEFLSYDVNLSGNLLLYQNYEGIQTTTNHATAYSMQLSIDLNLLQSYFAYSKVLENSSTDIPSQSHMNQTLLPTDPLLQSSNYAQGNTAYAWDISTTIDDIALGTRYVHIENPQSLVSYHTGIYSTFPFEFFFEGTLGITYELSNDVSKQDTLLIHFNNTY